MIGNAGTAVQDEQRKLLTGPLSFYRETRNAVSKLQEEPEQESVRSSLLHRASPLTNGKNDPTQKPSILPPKP